MAAPRFLDRFTSADETWEFAFPRNRMEYVSSQGLRSPRDHVSGAHYSYRQRGSQVALKDVASERCRFVMVGDAEELNDLLDEMRANLFLGAFGKLYLSDGRWAWAELTSMPEVTIAYNSPRIVPVILGFTRFDDWCGIEVVEEYELDSASMTFDVTNPGTAVIYDAVMTLRGTYTDPSFTNNNTGYGWSSTRDGTHANHRLRVDAGRGEVERSTDGGSTWADDYAEFSLPAEQVQMMVLNPGVNSIDYADDGSPAAVLEIRYYPRWH